MLTCRAVIENHYSFLKGLNPSLRFLVRERTDPNYDPVVQAEFGMGKVEEVSVKGMSEAEVLGEFPFLFTSQEAASEWFCACTSERWLYWRCEDALGFERILNRRSTATSLATFHVMRMDTI